MEETKNLDTTNVVNETEDNKDPISMKDIENLTKVVNSDILRRDIEDKKKTINEAKSDFLGTVVDGNDVEFVEENLKRFKTIESLKSYLTSNERILELFTNPYTGYVLPVNITNNLSEMVFRKDLLLYLKESQIQMANIDAEYEKLDQATKEFQTNIDDACYQLADNVLIYINGLKERIAKCEDSVARDRMNRSIKALESGFTMELYKETYTKYPSAIARCKEFIKKEKEIISIGKRYMAKLKSAKTNVNLFEFVSDATNKKSFEEMVFSPDEYKSPIDMFAFSLIRYFSMSDWSDVSVVQGHATLVLNMRKLVTNDIDDEVKVRLKAAILDYLTLFE